MYRAFWDLVRICLIFRSVLILTSRFRVTWVINKQINNSTDEVHPIKNYLWFLLSEFWLLQLFHLKISFPFDKYMSFTFTLLVFLPRHFLYRFREYNVLFQTCIVCFQGVHTIHVMSQISLHFKNNMNNFHIQIQHSHFAGIWLSWYTSNTNKYPSHPNFCSSVVMSWRVSWYYLCYTKNGVSLAMYLIVFHSNGATINVITWFQINF